MVAGAGIELLHITTQQYKYVASVSRVGQQELFRRGKLGTIITVRKQVAVDIRRHLDRRVAQAVLHHLKRQLQSTLGAPSRRGLARREFAIHLLLIKS